MLTLIALLAVGCQEPPEPPRPPAEPRRSQERDGERRQDPRPPPPPGAVPPVPGAPPMPGGRQAPPVRPGEAPAPVRPVWDPEEVRAWLREHEPETYRRVLELQEAGRPTEAMRLLAEAEGRIRQQLEMRERDPKGFERMQEMRRLEGECGGLAERARRASVEERDRVVKQLSESLATLFDLREEARMRDVVELKRRVEALEKELATRKANKEKIVEQRKREMLGEKGEFDW